MELSLCILDPTVAAVFATLSQDDDSPTPKESKINKDIDEIILNAKTVNGLLNIVERNKDLSRKHALKVFYSIQFKSSFN